jgi:hypothetical protein
MQKLGSITCASLINYLNLMQRLKELRFAGSVMKLTSTVPLVTLALKPPSSLSLPFLRLLASPGLLIVSPCSCCVALRNDVVVFPELTNFQFISLLPFSSSLLVVAIVLLFVWGMYLRGSYVVH